jgi:hypothetical protein
VSSVAVLAAEVKDLPDLASALNDLGIRLSELGRREEALTTEEAVSTYRRLAETIPAAYLPNLAETLLGFALGARRRRC